jgi:hypothetical protein
MEAPFSIESVPVEVAATFFNVAGSKSMQRLHHEVLQ